MNKQSNLVTKFRTPDLDLIAGEENYCSHMVGGVGRMYVRTYMHPWMTLINERITRSKPILVKFGGSIHFVAHIKYQIENGLHFNIDYKNVYWNSR